MLKIRNTRSEDIEGIAQMEKRIFPDPWSARSLTDTLEQKQTLLLSAFDGSRLIGYVILYYVLEDGEIARIAVEEEYRRRRVASRLLAELEMLCFGNGISRLMLDVRESNAAARSFYENHGFERDGLRKNYYTNPAEHAVLMSCNIGPNRK